MTPEAAVELPPPPCECLHTKRRHSVVTSYCWAIDCKCSRYRPQKGS